MLIVDQGYIVRFRSAKVEPTFHHAQITLFLLLKLVFFHLRLILLLDLGLYLGLVIVHLHVFPQVEGFLLKVVPGAIDIMLGLLPILVLLCQQQLSFHFLVESLLLLLNK